MITLMILGHLAVSYILSQTPALLGKPITPLEQGAIIASGYLLDWDILLPGRLGGSNHHYSPTHTPFFAFLIFGGLYFFLNFFFQPLTLFLIGISLFSHLVLDDLSYWFYKLGFKGGINIKQIIWLYPFQKRSPEVIQKATQRRIPVRTALGNYLKLKFIMGTELIFVFVSVIFLIISFLSHIDSNRAHLTQENQTSTIQKTTF